MKSSTWNRADGSSPEQLATHVQPAGLGVRGRGILEEEPPGVPRGTRRHRARLSSDRLNGVRTHDSPCLTVSGLRCIEHAELGTPPGVAPGYGDHGSGKASPLEATFLLDLGRLFPMENSRCQIQPGQGHLRIIAGRWPFWAPRAWASSHPGRSVCADPCSEGAATTRGQGQ